MGARDVEIYSDSWLIVNQVQGNFEAQDFRMKAYLQAAGSKANHKQVLYGKGGPNGPGAKQTH